MREWRREEEEGRPLEAEGDLGDLAGASRGWVRRRIASLECLPEEQLCQRY